MCSIRVGHLLHDFATPLAILVAGTVAGKAQQITIKLENMVGTMNFNGGLKDNASNVESTLAEMMARILGMAETAA